MNCLFSDSYYVNALRQIFITLNKQAFFRGNAASLFKSKTRGLLKHSRIE